MIEIASGSCRARISPERGAIVTSLELDGQEALFLDQATFDDPAKNVRGGIPVLFPLCGPLPEPEYRWEGQSYAMRQHGFARSMPWTVLEQRPDLLSVELRDTPETLQQFPFPFSYRLDYQVEATGLRIVSLISNRGLEPMPVQFGFHPYFKVGNKETLEFDLPVRTYSDNKSEEEGQFSGFDFTADEIDWAFPKPSGHKASFRDPSRGVNVTVEFGDVYSVLVFWTLKGSHFVCVEPWSSSRLAFPYGEDIHTIAPGGKLASHVSVGITAL